jgi:uncharacterized integral membrane protein (TIGR00698 family)
MIKKIVFVVLAVLSLGPWLNPALALLLGLTFTLSLGNPFPSASKTATNWLLKIAIVGLGFGINAQETLALSADGFWLTFISITLTMLLGAWLTKRLGLATKSGYLLSSGTAICGGSAIAAIAPVIKASPKDISMAMGTVFLLNSLALLIFPPIGQWLALSQAQFGLWSAIAIHDTSSVVGAASIYGEEALKIATTVKLARALWIIPLALITSLIFKSQGKIKYPYFIGLFIVAVLLNSFFNLPTLLTDNVVLIARRLMSLTIFLVGANLSLAQIKEAGWPSLSLGVILWLVIASGSLAVIYWL